MKFTDWRPLTSLKDEYIDIVIQGLDSGDVCDYSEIFINFIEQMWMLRIDTEIADYLVYEYLSHTIDDLIKISQELNHDYPPRGVGGMS